MKPRPSILLTACYGAGLATGLLHFGSPLGMAVLLLAAPLIGGPLPIVLSAAAAAGRVTGELAREGERTRCPARLPPGRLRLTIELLEPAPREGGRLMVKPVGTGCVGAVAARWPPGRPADAGLHGPAVAVWIPAPGPGGRPAGSLAVIEVGPLGGHPGLAARLRTVLAGASLSLYGARAPLVDALMLNRRGGIDPELQDRFAQSGLVHLLSISGFHVGLITAWVFLLGRLLGLGRSRALVLAAAVSAAYVGFLGWPAPATRAAALAAIAARSRVHQRHVQSDALLAATCLSVLLVDPWAILDLGGWLSAAALWGASRFTRWTDRAIGTGALWRTLGSSVGATLATAPITAGALGTVALAGIALNFVAIPLAAIAVPGVLASLLLYPLAPALARPFAAGAGLGLHLLELAASAGAAIPGGHMLVQPGDPRVVLVWVAVLGVALWVMGTRNTLAEAGRRTGWCAAAVLWLSLARTAVPGSADSDRDLTLHFLDVGQGDAAVLRTPRGHWIVVDAGPADERADAGRRVVVPFLERHGVRSLTLVVVSHAHADHEGGVPSVLRRLPAALVLEPGAPVPDPRYLRFLDGLRVGRVPWHPGRTGEHFSVDGVSFTVLHPSPGWSGWGEDVNEDSLVLLVEFGAFQAVFAGDAGLPAEADMRSRLRRVDLLKVGHHGSRGATGDEWLDSLHPTAAVISVGRNDYGHPAPATLERLAAHGVDMHRTDREGTVSVVTDGVRMTIESKRARVSYDVR
ncbi:MAG TPA: DNA internalization-related competence protein ComEC/Rec2 [Gemmatimonadales bacterium]|nr:DNA internalization-related competence protein ComEC/Rec2 [Gemmatimonadales bacterium]